MIQGGIIMSLSINSIMSGSYFGITSDFFNESFSSSGNTSYLSDFSSIKSGSYYKLMKAYYGGNSTAKSLVGSSSDATTTASDRINTASIRDEATALNTSAAKLLVTGSKSLFNKTTVKDADGKETQGYDMNSIYKAVSTFADQYNSLMKSTADSGNTSVLTSAASMAGNTKANATLLDHVGITVNSDNTLSVDEDKFKASQISAVQSLFNGTGSYAYGIASNASQIYNQSVSQLAQLAGTSYSSAGSYSYTNLNTDSLFNSFL